MALKKIKQPDTLKGSPVSIWFDDEWEGYQVHVKGKPKPSNIVRSKPRTGPS